MSPLAKIKIETAAPSHRQTSNRLKLAEGDLLPEDLRLPAIKDSLKWEYGRSLARLDQRLQGPFLMGDTMSIPDIIATHCLLWGIGAKFPAPSDALTAYLARMRARPAYLRAMSPR